MRRTVLLWLTVAAAVACHDGDEPAPEPRPGTLLESCGRAQLFRVTEVLTPDSAADSRTYSLDLDSDGNIENRLGNLQRFLLSRFPTEETWIQRAIASGELSWFIEVEECNSVENGVYTRLSSLRATDGQPVRDDQLVRAIASGEDRAIARHGEGWFPISAFAEFPDNPPGDVRWTVAEGFSARFGVTGNQLEAIVAGGLTPQAVRGLLFPSLAVGMNRVVSETPGCPSECVEESEGDLVLRLFDDDKDGNVTAGELESNSLLASISDPDVDLIGTYDGEPIYWPSHDGYQDHMSFGVRILAELWEP